MARTVAGSLVAAWPPLTGRRRAVDPAAAGAPRSKELCMRKPPPQIYRGALGVVPAAHHRHIGDVSGWPNANKEFADSGILSFWR